MNLEKKYYAKLMLAGEYGVIVGSEALTVPLKNFHAQFAHGEMESETDEVIKSVSSLRGLLSYIESLPKNSLHAIAKVKELSIVLNDGYYIKSNIPQAYGIGSSGAVSALVYDQFFDRKESLSRQKQREDLAVIESFYHGKSSGVDAMSSYTGHPLHFLPDGELIRIDVDPIHPPGGYQFFLLDSGEVLDTRPLVKTFLDNMKKETYKNLITDDYIPLIQKFIGTLTASREGDPAMVFRAISDFQWQHFRDMIPTSMEDHWIEGQVSNTYYLKLNGSGGGFMLGIAHEDSKEAIEEMLEGPRISWL